MNLKSLEALSRTTRLSFLLLHYKWGNWGSGEVKSFAELGMWQMLELCSRFLDLQSHVYNHGIIPLSPESPLCPMWRKVTNQLKLWIGGSLTDLPIEGMRNKDNVSLSPRMQAASFSQRLCQPKTVGKEGWARMLHTLASQPLLPPRILPIHCIQEGCSSKVWDTGMTAQGEQRPQEDTLRMSPWRVLLHFIFW